VQILNARDNSTPIEQREINEHFIRHHSNYDLAKYIVYTKDKTPEETCDEILSWVRGGK
jgi:hypothetical protein